MSIDRGDTDEGARASAGQLLAHAQAGQRRADRRLAQMIDDFFVPGDARLDDRMRATLAATLAAMVAAVEGDIRRRAARVTSNATRDLADGKPVLDRLIATGLLRDSQLMGELIARTRQDLLADQLPAAPADEAGAASLLARLSASADSVVAKAALALMVAESRRRGFLDGNRLSQTELPAELHHKLVWWVAAAVREQVSDAGSDRAVAEAALRALANHDESDRVEGAAMRLAAAIDAHASELPALIVHSLGDRRVALFIALLAHALGVDFAAMREVVIEGDDRLWIGLRAAGLDRSVVARVGLSLYEADPRRDVETFAGQLDAIVAITPDEARDALAPLRLHPDFRAAIAALEDKK